MPTLCAELLVEERFRGFEGLALGGYLGGRLAAGLRSAEVKLRRPVPVGQRLFLEERGAGIRELLDAEGTVLARARPAEVELSPPRAVAVAEAAAASEGSLQRSGVRHPFPGCFTCGDGRAEGDGLRLFAGPVAGGGLVAAAWTPPPALADGADQVQPELVWAALDCPTIMAAVFASAPDERLRVVTRQLAVALRGPVRTGRPHAVVAWLAAREARLLVTGGAVLGADGEVLAVARHALAPADWGVPLGRARWG